MSQAPVCILVATWIISVAVTASSRIAANDHMAAHRVAGFERFARPGDVAAEMGGRVLATELSCTACHATEDAQLQPKLGPRLSGAGSRLQPEWLGRHLSDPQQVKPGGTMPHLLATMSESDRRQVVAALVAFLESQQQAFPRLVSNAANPIAHEFWLRGDASRGAQLYHQVGCVACHDPDPNYAVNAPPPSAQEQLLAQLEPEELEELGLASVVRPIPSIPHGELATKYTRQSLTFFLLDPLESRPGGRMPNLKLTAHEAADLAAYLLDSHAPADIADLAQPNVVAPSALLNEGRRWFAELRCMNCHEVQPQLDPRPATAWDQLDWDAPQTCMTGQHQGLPAYNLDPVQRHALRAAASSHRRQASAAERVTEHMLRWNCYACHERGTLGGVGSQRRAYFETAGHVDLGDEGRVPPPLTGVGGKLHTAALRQIFEGKGDVRPYLLARMPRLTSAAAEPLLEWLPEADGAAAGTAEQAPLVKPEWAEAGRQLVDSGCVQCHPLRGEYLAGVAGIDLLHAKTRLRPGWFHNFLLNPAEWKRGTRMPTFFAGGRSANTAILEGNVEQQISAIWSYLNDLERQPLPEKILNERQHNFELVPTERPILLRTFMRDVGPYAIAVGFPEGVHFAFDAEAARPALAWRGRYLDAHATWFDRFTPPAEPLGTEVIRFPATAILIGDRDEREPLTRRFGGYQLNDEGVPAFLYQCGPFELVDRFEPGATGGLRRTLQITVAKDQKAPHAQVWLQCLSGTTLERIDATTCVDPQGLRVQLPGAIRGAIIRDTAGGQEWLVPVDVQAPRTEIKLEYAW